MAEQIYLRKGNELEAMKEVPFEKEDELQELIADHPELLDGEQIMPGNSRRWILIRREMGLSQSKDGADWWSVDHLLIDHEAIPTLVEMKLRENPEVRRKVVGQMLDYAAHAEHWTAEALRERFEERNENHDADLKRRKEASQLRGGRRRLGSAQEPFLEGRGHEPRGKEPTPAIRSGCDTGYAY